MKKFFIANRAEVAVRIARTASELGYTTVGVYATDDAAAAHVSALDEAIALGAEGVNAYLDPDRLVEAAVSSGCFAVHPGWGFLSESADFARRCEQAGLLFIGPTPSQLEIFADKVSARSLASQYDISLARFTACSLGSIRPNSSALKYPLPRIVTWDRGKPSFSKAE